MEPVILHSDMNNFYATVECLDNPSLRGKPMAVAGDPDARHGIVLAKNYEAKSYGKLPGIPYGWHGKNARILFLPRLVMTVIFSFPKLPMRFMGNTPIR